MGICVYAYIVSYMCGCACMCVSVHVCECVYVSAGGNEFE